MTDVDLDALEQWHRDQICAPGDASEQTANALAALRRELDEARYDNRLLDERLGAAVQGHAELEAANAALRRELDEARAGHHLHGNLQRQAETIALMAAALSYLENHFPREYEEAMERAAPAAPKERAHD